MTIKLKDLMQKIKRTPHWVVDADEMDEFIPSYYTWCLDENIYADCAVKRIRPHILIYGKEASAGVAIFIDTKHKIEESEDKTMKLKDIMPLIKVDELPGELMIIEDGHLNDYSNKYDGYEVKDIGFDVERGFVDEILGFMYIEVEKCKS